MQDICIMTWKTFLALFKRNYNLFEVFINDWYFKGTNTRIILKYYDDTIENGTIMFLHKESVSYAKI